MTMPWTTDRPRPVPSPGPLVVKNGSKIRSRTAGSIPAPVSVTESSTYSPAGTPNRSPSSAPRRTGAAAMPSFPPSTRIACRAFEARFNRTWCSCAASARTTHGDWSSSTTISMVAGRVARRKLTASLTAA